MNRISYLVGSKTEIYQALAERLHRNPIGNPVKNVFLEIMDMGGEAIDFRDEFNMISMVLTLHEVDVTVREKVVQKGSKHRARFICLAWRLNCFSVVVYSRQKSRFISLQYSDIVLYRS